MGGICCGCLTQGPYTLTMIKDQLASFKRRQKKCPHEIVNATLRKHINVPQSAPWLVSVSAAFWQSGKCPLPLRSASSPARCSEWWRPPCDPRQHCNQNSHRLTGLPTSEGGRSCATSSPAMNTDWSILAKLLLRFVHLTNEIDEAFTGFGHTLLGPVSELELTDCSRLAVLRVRIW